MKKILLSFCIGIVVLACASEEASTMVVEGQVAGLKKGTLYLQHVPDSTLITLDSLVVKGDGAFRFEVPLDYPELFYLYLDKADNNVINDRLSFFGEPGEMNIQTRWDGFDTRANISGSQTHVLYSEYKQVMSQFNMEYLSLVQERLGITDSTRIEFLRDSLDQRIEQNTLRTYLYAVNFALNNKESHIAPYVVVVDVPEVQTRFLDTIFNALPDSIVAGTYGQRLKKMLESRKEE